MKSYSELTQLQTYAERFKYLMLGGNVGERTFGEERYLNQQFYISPMWKEVRRYVITRDIGCDMGLLGYEISGGLYVHHINPITIDDVIYNRDILTDPENLITVSFGTHNAIHYGDLSWIESQEPIVRTPGDTCPWR